MATAYDTTQPRSTMLISADRVQGTDVYNPGGEHIGHIEDVMIDKVSGKIAYAVMGFGGFLGIGEKYHPLPWSILKYDVSKGGYVVPLEREVLENAPSYDLGDLKPDDPVWGNRVHDYYRVPPYWI